MKVKIGNKIYDGKDEPVMVILSDDDKKLIYRMAEADTKYCVYPDNMSPEEASEFMKTD